MKLKLLQNRTNRIAAIAGCSILLISAISFTIYNSSAALHLFNMGESGRIKNNIRISADSRAIHAPLFLMNTYTAGGITVTCRTEKDLQHAINSFKKGKTDILACSLPEFLCAQESLEKNKPLVFFITGYSAGDTSLFSQKNIAVAKGTRIACVENSSAHTSALFFIMQNNIAAKDIHWKFTDTADEAADLLQKGKSDIAAIDSSSLHYLQYIKTLYTVFSTREASRLIPFVLIAREDLMLSQPDALALIIRTWYMLTSEKNFVQDRAAYYKKTSGISESDDALRAALFETASFSDNRRLFLLGENRSPLTYTEYFTHIMTMLSSVQSSHNILLPLDTFDSIIIQNLSADKILMQQTYTAQSDNQTAASARTTKLFVQHINFAQNAPAPQAGTLAAIDNAAQLLRMMPRVTLRIEGRATSAEETPEYMSQRRAQETATIFISKYSIDQRRIVTAKGASSASTGGVDLIFERTVTEAAK